MRYAVLGAGAMGAVVGGLLARGGCDVVLWDINDAHIQAINEYGLRLDLPEHSETIDITATRPDQSGDVDVILVLTKTLHTDAALAGVKDKIANGSAVVGLQNGLANEAVLARHVPSAQLFYGCTLMPGRFHGPGHVSSQGRGSAVFRSIEDRATVDFAVDVPGFALVHDQANADAIIWQKAAFNCAMNSIMALQGGTIGALADQPDGVTLAHDTASEVVAVAHAKGIDADLSAVHAHIDRSLAHHREHKPSMLQDIEASRETEIDALCGAVVDQAGMLGIDVPINKTLAVLVRLKSAVLRERAA